MMGWALAREPIVRPTVALGRPIVTRRLGQNIAENTSEPGPLRTGPARVV